MEDKIYHYSFQQFIEIFVHVTEGVIYSTKNKTTFGTTKVYVDNCHGIIFSLALSQSRARKLNS